MKTKKSLLSMLAIALVYFATAVEKPKTNVQLLNADQLLVTIQTENASKMEVSINNENGNIVYYKQSKKPISTYNKIFDVKNLENGEYAMKLEVNGSVSERKFVIADDKIDVKKAIEQVPPFFLFDGKKLVVTHLNFEKEKYDLKIYNDQMLVYETSVGDETTINAGFDLSKMEKGTYVVFLNSDNYDYNYRFDKINRK